MPKLSIIKLFVGAALAFILTALLASSAHALDYAVSAFWSDPTPSGPAYMPEYDAEWKIDDGTVNKVGNLASPAYSFNLSADPGAIFSTRVRAVNKIGDIVGNWTEWFSATVPHQPVSPSEQGPVTIQFTIIVP